MDSFEFSKEDDKTFTGLSTIFKRVGIVWIILGVFSMIHYFVLDYAIGYEFALIVGIIVFAAINVGFGITIFRPADNLQKIADTSGSDIKEMMNVVEELAGGFKFVNIIIAVGLTAYVLAVIFFG